MLRHSVTAAVAVAGLLAVGCLGTDRHKDPLILPANAPAKTGGTGLPSPQAAKPAAFDPQATGGSGVSVQNSFGRTVPGPGTGTLPGTTPGVASKLPAPEIGISGPVAPPVIAGARYGEQMTDDGRSAGVRRASASEPPPSLPPPSSPFGPEPPKLNPPESEPPVKPVLTPPTPAPTTLTPTPPTPPGPLPLVQPPTTDPLPLPPVAPPSPVPLPPPVMPALPSSSTPLPPSVIPSPVDAPPVMPAPKLPAAPPIRPQ